MAAASRSRSGRSTPAHLSASAQKSQLSSSGITTCPPSTSFWRRPREPTPCRKAPSRRDRSMLSLLEIQRLMRDAVIADGPARAPPPLLTGGRDPQARLAIHCHHYQASLTRALLDKFPAVCWLVGERFATAAAQAFARAYPPAAPCIAEYGADYPAFLASRAGAERLPYLRAFAELEWHVGQVSIAVDRPPLTIESLALIDAGALPDHRL